MFYRMGFGDEGIVALSGAHTLGRAFKVFKSLECLSAQGCCCLQCGTSGGTGGSVSTEQPRGDGEDRRYQPLRACKVSR